MPERARTECWFPGNDALVEKLAARYCDPQELPPMEVRALYCRSCRALWRSDGDCACTCVDGAPGYEDWVSCSCKPDEGCDEEGDPGCAYCQAVDPYEPCPADRDEEEN